MSQRFLTLLVFSTVLSAAAAAQAPAPVPGDQRPADRDAIRAHIMSIFAGFRERDRAKLRETHAVEWRGFLTGSRDIIRGIDEYMAFIEPELNNPPDTNDYVLSQFDVLFYGDVAVVDFVADAVLPGGKQPVFRIMDIYTKQADGSWIQSASHTTLHPATTARQMQQAAQMPEPARRSLLAAREELWRAWFANDRAKLERMLPEDTLAINYGDGPWQDRAAILEDAKQFAAAGNKLVRLEFPRTEIRAYGFTAILYTTYVLETESAQGERQTASGRATEVFVLRDGKWVNPGWHMDSGR